MLLRERVFGLRLVAQRGRADRARAQCGHCRQRRTLVLRVALHRGDQLRHQVVAARQLHVDVAPRRAHLVARGNQVVEDDHERRDDHEGDRAKPPPEHAQPPLKTARMLLGDGRGLL